MNPAPAQVARGPAPALGGAPAAGLAAPPTAAILTPQVESYDEETHRCTANDSFRAISQKYYQSDRYAQALWLFNRNHPMAAEGVQQNPPVLQAGTAVYIPPTRILEKYYASALSGAAAGAETAAAAASAERQYRVRRSGETVYDIARRTLGSGDRWMEIYRLNQQQRLDPMSPVPAGLVLRLPADARVAPEDLP